MSEAGSWRRLKDVFDAALERPTGEAAFIAQACGDDRSLHYEVRSLLVAHEQPDGFCRCPRSSPPIATLCASCISSWARWPDLWPRREPHPKRAHLADMAAAITRCDAALDHLGGGAR